MADLGYIALFLALVASVYSVIAFIFGERNRHLALLDSAKNSLLVVCGLVSIAVMALAYSLITHDFQVAYVASYTSRTLSTPYLISALWAGNAGSLLFWGWLLSIFGAVVVLQKRDTGKALVPYASSIIMVTEAFFLTLLILVANPFQKLAFVPADGNGLNPLLQNPGMLFHPPFLLAGYVGFTVPFAFAIAALLTRRLGDEWLITIRRWTLLTWLILGVGNILGAWWAYVELGWGGYWAWDPVESAGFMPWLVATAFLHSVMMQRRRGILKVWNMVLIILTFTLSIFGTFLTRSGILSSVHSFGESTLGPFFSVFMGVALIGSLGLLFYRSGELQGESEMESLVSRESTFLLNNLLLVGAAFATFLGTIFPLISEAVRGVKINVGPPFFNQVNVPIFLAIILLAGICTLIGWRQASVKNLLHHFLWPLVAAVILGIVLFILGIREVYALIAFPVCGFVLFTIFYEWWRGTRARHNVRNENYLRAFWGLVTSNRPRYGGYIVHIGIIILAIGIAGSSLYTVNREVSIKPEESITIKNYTLTYETRDSFQTEGKNVDITTLLVYNKSILLGRVTPQKYLQLSDQQAVSEVAIRSTLVEDLYVILLGLDADGTAAFKVVVNPLVSWIWIGGVVFLVGGLVAFWPERRKLPVQNTENGRGNGRKIAGRKTQPVNNGAKPRTGSRSGVRRS